MIENSSKSSSSFATNSNSARYIGVASMHIVAVNPKNETLKKFGWIVPDDAEEQKYVVEDVDENGKIVKKCRIRFLAQINDFPNKPVIPLDFTCKTGKVIGKKSNKCKIIDEYGRTAWATIDEFKAHKVPVYETGEANISTPYKPCHAGEEEIVKLLFKYLNVAPFRKMDPNTKEWIENTNPGKVTIDDWNKLCDGDVTELVEDLKQQPYNSFKVVLGIRTNPETNKTYQTFLNSDYINNNASPEDATGEYKRARKLIDDFYKNFPDSPSRFNATPVQEWKEQASDVKDNSNVDEDKFDPTLDDLPF